MAYQTRSDRRNVAIIAHVDHGKTTLVDALLKQSNIFHAHEHVGTLIMDRNELEREKGITILAKNTAITYRDVTINIIDTPGHADFGGEVERVLGMADGCLLLVDAVEGPMPQTRFVLRKAFALGLRPIVLINKIDRPNARLPWVLGAIQDLFLDLATDDDQLDFPVLYANAKAGRVGADPENPGDSVQPLLDTILSQVPPPVVELDGPAQLLVTSFEYDSYRGKIATGRLVRGQLRAGQSVVRFARDGGQTRHQLTALFQTHGLERREVESVDAGDIVAVAGVADIAIGETIADAAAPEALPVLAVEEPTLQMSFGVNTSPFGGRDGRFVTSRHLRERLYREQEANVGLRVEDTDDPDVFLVSGRGELHLSIVVETMRREGYEFQVSRPEVITKEIGGRLCEPMEHLIIDTPEQHIGVLTEQLAQRKARLVNLAHDGAGQVRLEFTIPTRGLIGFRNQALTLTRGEAVLSSLLLGYEPWLGDLGHTRNGALVAAETGTAVTYGLNNAQGRGATFIDPGTAVYEGMIVGLNSRGEDIAINVCKEKKQTNIRSSTADIAVKLTPALKLSLEQSLDFIQADELVEVTPKAIRLRKRLLHAEDRQKARKDGR